MRFKSRLLKAYLWAFRSNDLDGGPPIIVFDYQPGRSGSHARNFLGAWQGHLMFDDYGGYKALFRGDGKTAPCIELACLAHVRRASGQPKSHGTGSPAAHRYALCD